MRRLWFFAIALVACSSDTGDTDSLTAVSLDATAPSLGLVLDATPDTANGTQRGRVPGDSALRVLVQRRVYDDAEARLCGVVGISGPGMTMGVMRVPLPSILPYDAAAPRLAARIIGEGDVQGVRFVVPGTDARYVFEGLTRDGTRLVSVRWPVVTDPARRIPVGASDSLIEASLRPLPATLDSLVRALRIDAAEMSAVLPPGDTIVRRGHAVPMLGELPVHELRVPTVCTEVTVSVPAVARVDQMLKISVRAGETVYADASVTDGQVRLSFDEAPPLPESTERRSYPHAAVVAAHDGRVTLRVRVQVVPRVQAAQQVVFVKVRRTFAR
jgi:hypothetical protein